MRRSTIIIDRLAVLVTGIVLAGAGLVLIAWPAGWLADVRPATPDRITTAPGTELAAQQWWPWACAGAGMLAVVLGAWWLIAHLPRRAVGALLLPGSGKEGRLLLVPAGAAEVAAGVLAETPGVRSAHGKVVPDRGATVVVIDAVTEPHADLADITAAADRVTADLRTVLGRDDVTARILLSVARRRRSVSVVR